MAACQSVQNRKIAVQTPPPPDGLQTLPPRLAKPLFDSPYAPLPDAVDALIRQANSLYTAGMADYRAGDLEEAKGKFDKAIAVLLDSGYDVRNNDRLDAEFDELVENIHNVELASLERGGPLGAPPYEPTPIESFADLTFPVNPNVKQRVQREAKLVRSDLPLVTNDYVAGVINYFQTAKSGRKFIQRVIERSGLYKPIISKDLHREGLPQDLIYVAGAESAFNPFALSRAGAKGLWQFMLGRAEQYGLKKNSWVDEREDPVKSTEAATHHLKDLYQMFGDWYLALAAYNCGPVTVQKAVEKTGYADFWKLRRLGALPEETQNYVPIILATALIAKDPQAFGFSVKPDPPLDTQQVVVTAPTDLRLVAELIDKPVNQLIQLNPSLLRWTTPPNDPHFVLNLPAGTKQLFEQGIASIPSDKRTWWRAYRVEEGDTLASIARKFHVSESALARANHIDHDLSVHRGDRLVLPLSPYLTEATRHRRRQVVNYRIRRGDTLSAIANRFSVTPHDIQRWNHLAGSRIIAGKRLRLYVAGRRSYRRHYAYACGNGPRRLVHYRIRHGDTLLAIAHRFCITPHDIQRWNHLEGSEIVAGKSLRLYVAERHSSRGRYAQREHRSAPRKSKSSRYARSHHRLKQRSASRHRVLAKDKARAHSTGKSASKRKTSVDFATIAPR